MKKYILLYALIALVTYPLYVAPVTAALLAWEAKKREEDEWWWYLLLYGAFLVLLSAVVYFLATEARRIGLPDFPFRLEAGYHLFWWGVFIIGLSTGIHFGALALSPIRGSAYKLQKIPITAVTESGEGLVEEKREEGADRDRVTREGRSCKADEELVVV